MDQPAVAPRQFVTQVESRQASLLAGLGLGLLLGLLALLLVEGPWRWPLLAVALVAGVALAPLWAPVETLWLEGARLVRKKRRGTTVVDLSRLSSVTRDWVPRKGDTLTLTDDDAQSINIWLLDERTEALRSAVGERARFTRANTDLHNPTTRRLLLLDRG